MIAEETVLLLGESESLAYLSKRLNETGQETEIYNMIVGSTNYTFPANYSLSDKIASVLLSCEQCLEAKTLTWGPGGVVILEEPTDPEVYAMLLERYSSIPDDNSNAGDIYEQQELDGYVTDVLNELKCTSAKACGPVGSHR